MSLFKKWILQGIQKYYRGLLTILGFIAYIIIEALLMNAGYFWIAFTLPAVLACILVGSMLFVLLKERYENFKKEETKNN